MTTAGEITKEIKELSVIIHWLWVGGRTTLPHIFRVKCNGDDDDVGPPAPDAGRPRRCVWLSRSGPFNWTPLIFSDMICKWDPWR